METAHHGVYTYQDPRTLAAAVAAWLAPALHEGGGSLIACRPAHAPLVRDALAASGLDVAALEQEGRLAFHDAHELLGRFMIRDAPDGRAFKTMARSLISSIRHAGATGTVRIWGEMVDVLAKRQQYDAAKRLEQLWNEVLNEDDLALLCSYAVEALDASTHARLLIDVCSTHTRVETEEGDALDEAVTAALKDTFGREGGRIMADILPTRRFLLDRMCAGSAMLISLRSLDPELGAEVQRLARERIMTSVDPYVLR